MNQWLRFPKDQAKFPIHIGPSKTPLTSPKIYLLVRANLEHYYPHQAEIIEVNNWNYNFINIGTDWFLQLENFGEPCGWRVNNFFEVILKTDLDNITKMVNCLSNGNIDINHELQLLKIEGLWMCVWVPNFFCVIIFFVAVVDIEGSLSKIKYDKIFPLEQRLKYSCAEVHWRNFVSSLKEMYSKINEITVK